MRTVLLKLVDAYKMILSPVVGGQCRFYPSCSAYAREAVEKHGLWRAMGLSVKRFLRCHPLNPGGVDLVPRETMTNVQDPMTNEFPNPNSQFGH